jgi:hypothetical protein
MFGFWIFCVRRSVYFLNIVIFVCFIVVIEIGCYNKYERIRKTPTEIDIVNERCKMREGIRVEFIYSSEVIRDFL